MRFLTMLAALGAAMAGLPGCRSIPDGETWQIDNLALIGGYPVTVRGDPRVIDTPASPAVEFDGVDDAIFLDTHPLEGMSEFTVEIVFRPAADGAREQRFFHMQESATESRVMFETRLVGDGQWFLDTYIKSGDEGVTLYAEDDLHAIGPWYHAAIVVGGGRFEHYVNGQRELAAPLRYSAQGPGRTSLGVRINEVHWFKGAIRTVRITPRALDPGAFLQVARD